MIERGERYDKRNWKWQKVTLHINSVIEKSPHFQYIIMRIWGKFKTIKSNRKYVEKSDHLSGEIDFDNVFWINPKKIKYSSIKEFPVTKYSGKKIEGDWDKLEKPFNRLYVFTAFKERFVDEKEWNETEYYKNILDSIGRGTYWWECKNKSDLDQRFRFLDSLFLEIKEMGYKSQRKLLYENKDNNLTRIKDEITVNIGRDGDLLFNNGAHRLSIVKILGIEKIPIRIVVIHPKILKKLKNNEISFEKLLY
jgi:hypothetical protein